MAEGVGFEPTVALRLLLISSQMPLTTQPPFPLIHIYRLKCWFAHFKIDVFIAKLLFYTHLSLSLGCFRTHAKK